MRCSQIRHASLHLAEDDDSSVQSGCHHKVQAMVKNSCCGQTCETTERKKSNLGPHVVFRNLLVPIYLQQQVGPLTSNQGGKKSPDVNTKFCLFQVE